MTSALFCLRAMQAGIPISFFEEMSIGEILDILEEKASDYEAETVVELSGQEAVNLLTGGGAFHGDD